MIFSKPLRGPVMRGEITQSVRIWQSPRVRVGGRYPIGPGHIEVTRLQEIDLSDVTEDLARQTGFHNLAALMETARHGRGERVFLVDFTYVGPPPAA